MVRIIESRAPTNVLFISHSADLGGAELCLLDLVSRLNSNLFNPILVIPVRGPLADELDALNVEYYVRYVARWIVSPDVPRSRNLFRFVRDFRSRLWSIIALLDRHEIDVVYSNTITCIDGAVAARIKRLPHIFHAHEYLAGNRSLKSYLPEKLLLRITSSLASRIIAVSDEVAAAFNFDSSHKKAVSIYNGVDLARFRRARNIRDSIGDTLGFHRACKLVGIVGALIPAKGLLNAIYAARLVVDEFHDVRFLIVGEGEREFEKELTDLTTELSLNENVFFLGYRKDSNDILSSIDLLALSSESEAFPRILLEAMAASKPVVATRCGGPERIVEEGETGLLVPIGDPRLLAAAVLRLLKHPCDALRMGEAGRKKAEELYSMPKYIASIEGIINSMATS